MVFFKSSQPLLLWESRRVIAAWCFAIILTVIFLDGNHQAECTKKFKAIGEAYEVLSDPTKRAKYDRFLRYGGGGVGDGSVNQHQHQHHHQAATTYSTTPQSYSYRPSQHFDPFAQFDNLFRSDPFFQAAFQDMDDEFARRFANQNQQQQQQARGADDSALSGNTTALNSPRQRKVRSNKEGWLPLVNAPMWN